MLSYRRFIDYSHPRVIHLLHVQAKIQRSKFHMPQNIGFMGDGEVPVRKLYGGSFDFLQATNTTAKATTFKHTVQNCDNNCTKSIRDAFLVDV